MIVFLVLGCMMQRSVDQGAEMSPAAPPPPPMEMEEMKAMDGDKNKSAGTLSIIRGAKKDGLMGDSKGGVNLNELVGLNRLIEVGKNTGGLGSPKEQEQARVREWFPESFIWRPSLQTGNDGVASVDVLVPDQLTTWRLLALAHDANGQQTGTEHHFDSVLPVSVEPLVPGWLYVDDQIRVYGRASALGTSFTGRVEISAEGALLGSGGGAVDLGPGASRLVSSSIKATRSGSGQIRAEVFAPHRVDGAERVVVVRPRGRKISTQRGGLVPQTLTVQNSDATEQRISVRVFPGPLAFFQAELDRIADAPPAGTSYAVLQGVAALSTSAGIEIDTERLRKVRLLAWQRLVKLARSPPADLASRLLHGMGSPDDLLAKSLKDRLVRVTVEGQRGDGSWSSAERSTAQRVLVETSVAVRALPLDQEGPRLRAAGSLERLLSNVDDGFTAAWVLNSGVVDEGFREGLQAKVLKTVIEVDGVHTVRLPSRVRNAQGVRPSRAEVLAVVVLALHGRDDLPWKGELVSELLQQWSASRGFGAGWADAVALDAIRTSMPALDKPVSISLSLNGVEVGRGGLDPKQPAVPVALDAVGGGEVVVACDPPLPGLAYVLTHTAWVPFTGEEALPGVDVEVELSALIAGQEGSVVLRIAAPSGAVVEVEQGVPAGTKIGAARGRIKSHSIQADHVRVTTKRFGAGEVITVRIPVTPQYAGVMHTPPLVIRSAGQEVQVAPRIWRVSKGDGA